LEKFQEVLQGFEVNGVYPLYILVGSFLSQSVYMSAGGKVITRAAFQALADVISRVPGQKRESKFLLVPGKHTVQEPSYMMLLLTLVFIA
jgi:hypothetical protein